MSSLLHPGESNLFSELRENGYYVWMNDRNDLFAGQIEGWAESNADEIYYCGQVKPAPRAVNRQGERNADVHQMMRLLMQLSKKSEDGKKNSLYVCFLG